MSRELRLLNDLFNTVVCMSNGTCGFSQFSKNIPKPFLTYSVACVLCSVAP